MTITTTTIICASILLLTALLAPLSNPFFRHRKIFRLLKSNRVPMQEQASDMSAHLAETDLTNDGERQTNGNEPLPDMQPLTVLITAHDDAAALERNLPAILNQDYPAGFRVIVVADRTDSETVDVLKRFTEGKQQQNNDVQTVDEGVKLFSVNHQLYYTLLPASSRYISRKKLAVTLGVKAAHTEWILLTDPQCHPASCRWLQAMASGIGTETTLVIGYTHYDDTTPASRRFERLHTAFYLMREDLVATAYRTNGSNLMFRKSMFMQGEGYRGNLELIRGEYDFLVNKYATPGQTRLVLNPDAWLTEDTPTATSWRSKHLFYLATRRLLKRSHSHRLLFCLDQIVLHLQLLLLLAALTFSILTTQWIIAGAASLSLLLTVILNDVIGARAIAPFDSNIPSWRIYFSRLAIVWRNLAYAVRYLRADKLDFTTHKQ